MKKTTKELAFLRDLYVTAEWTARFTDLAEKHLELPKKGKILYVNAGTGDDAVKLRESLHKDARVFAAVENNDLLAIAKAKAQIIKSDIAVQTLDNLKEKDFDAVLADASLVAPQDIQEHFTETVKTAKTGGEVSFLLPTAGSFGEIFSYLWEVFFNSNLSDRSPEIENLITEIPTVSDAETMAANAGLGKIETETKNEIFEYDTGADFIASPLVREFLVPRWLGFLKDKEKEQVLTKLARLIDDERDNLTFRFSVKATLVNGRKK